MSTRCRGCGARIAPRLATGALRACAVRDARCAMRDARCLRASLDAPRALSRWEAKMQPRADPAGADP